MRRFVVVAVAVLIALSTGCSGGRLQGFTRKHAPPHQVASVQTTIVLTGEDARVLARPIGSPQDEASLAANGIQPWGPVQAVHTVTIGNQQWVVNQLSSPDPFTATYQLPDGTIFVSNEPLESIVTFTGDEGPDPATVLWTSDAGDQWEVVPGRIQVYFTQEATEQELASLIATENLHVVMSWFEAPDDPGAGGNGMSMPGGGDKVLSATRGMAGKGLPAAKAASTSPSVGNEIAWFDFQFNPETYGTVNAAMQHFLSLPHVESALPLIIDYAQVHYAFPNDPIFRDGTDPYGRESRWIDAYDVILGTPAVPLLPYAGVQQEIAVMDCGVYRNHPDMGLLSNLGVEAYDRSYVVGIGRGDPNYEVTKPGMDVSYPQYWHRLHGHGTQVASLINGHTNNSVGVPSLAPGATVLPMRLKEWTKFYRLPGVNYEPTFSANCHVKAVRALRFELYHGAYAFMVRVVNMSFGYPAFIRNLPWPSNFPTGEFKKNVSRDLKWNDRLYVASAGNDDQQARKYPAAHDNVLGVSAVDYNSDYATYYWMFQYNHRPGNSSNYMPDETYPVSGVYLETHGFDFTGTTPPLPGYESEYRFYNPGVWDYRWYYPFVGTSAAAPQIAALAYHLYSKKAQQGIITTDPPLRVAVRNKIITSRGDDLGPVHGVANYQTALAGW